jgi:putative phosphoesterase
VILGILSDTHGRGPRTAAALQLLTQVGAQRFVHCGDVGDESVLNELAPHNAWVAFGNTDFPEARLHDYATALGLTTSQTPPLRFELNGKTFAVFHGHESRFSGLFRENPTEQSIRDELGHVDYILYGHTHVPADERIGRIRLINPGALHRATWHTVASLDVAKDTLRFWHVLDDPDEGPPTELSRRDLQVHR